MTGQVPSTPHSGPATLKEYPGTAGLCIRTTVPRPLTSWCATRRVTKPLSVSNTGSTEFVSVVIKVRWLMFIGQSLTCSNEEAENSECMIKAHVVQKKLSN